MKIIAIILTYNEEIHIERCLKNIQNFFDQIYIVDSFSQDKTKNIALNHKVIFLENKFVNHSQQFNWALSQIDQNVDWIFRIDADEMISEGLKNEIVYKLPKLDKSIKGIYINRFIVFQGKLLKYGGIFPNKVIRIFKKGYGYYENKWMDERLTINGSIASFDSKIIDNNLKPLEWWIKKHNIYSNKEALELIKNCYLSSKLGTLDKKNKLNTQTFNIKRIYLKLPLFIRPILYFIYRFFIRLGFLDGYQGFCFHFLQGLWYRFLVDAKYREFIIQVKKNQDPIITIKNILGIDFKEE